MVLNDKEGIDVDFLSHVGMGLLFAGVFFVLFRLRSQWARQVGNLRVLRYPWPLKILATIGVALISAALIALCKGISGMELLEAILVISPIVLLVLGGAGEVFAFEIGYDETTIYRCSP